MLRTHVAFKHVRLHGCSEQATITEGEHLYRANAIWAGSIAVHVHHGQAYAA